jgi:hypothetical protein
VAPPKRSNPASSARRRIRSTASSCCSASRRLKPSNVSCTARSRARRGFRSKAST